MKLPALAVVCLLALAPPPRMDLEVAVDRTELKWSRSGRLLGHLVRGTRLERLAVQAGWTRVGVHGWMWSASLDPSGDGLRVEPEEENLRARPNGEILGSLLRGVEIRRIGSEGKWYEIELIGWVPDFAVQPSGDDARGEADREASPDSGGGKEMVPAPPPALPMPSEAAPAGRLAQRTDLRSVPGGAIVAPLPAGLVLRPLETRGAWTRVAVEGWVPSQVVRAAAADASGPVAVALSPEAFEGRHVTWTVEHVALQQADRWRTDFEPGEHFDLARVPGGDGRTVYLVVPDGLLDEFRDLSPFETIRVEGRVRTGKSALTGNPILAVTRLLP